MMKLRNLFIFVVFVAMGCSEPNPGPEGFLPYSIPTYNGMHEERLRELDRLIEDQVYGDIHSVIILRYGKIIFEKYYGTYGRDDLHPLGAATQSITSSIFGVAMNQGSINSLNGALIDYFPQYPEYFEDIPQKDKITLRHVLSHTSGLWWDEWTAPYESPENDANAMSRSDDWVKFTLAKPMIQEPGTYFNFNSGNAILLAPILNSGTGVDFESYAGQNFFAKIGITAWEWEKIPGGEVNTAWGLHLRPMDFARIGYLYLNKGKWEGDSVFQENWAQRVAATRAFVSGYYNYGLHWWTFNGRADAVASLYTNDVFFAWGNSGQHLFITPHLQLVVAVSSGTLTNEHAVVDMIRDYIFPSIIDQ